MRSNRIVALAVGFAVAGAALATAQPKTGRVAYAPASEIPKDAFPSAVSVFESSGEAAGSLELRGQAVVIDPDADVLRRPVGLRFQENLGGTVEKQSWWPVAYSALIPGLGELSMGYWKRGVALMTLEALAWTGYFRNHNSGLDARDAYERFADENWDMRRWIDHHKIVYPETGWTLEELEEEGKIRSGNGIWPGYNPWVSKEEDKQHYYENIGKYDWYISGWEDYDPAAPEQQFDTELRDQYRAMRQESNDQLDTATKWTYLSIAARVFSLVETTLLVNKARKQADDMAMTDNRWMLRTRSRGRSGGEVALEYWFK